MTAQLGGAILVGAVVGAILAYNIHRLLVYTGMLIPPDDAGPPGGVAWLAPLGAIAGAVLGGQTFPHLWRTHQCQPLGGRRRRRPPPAGPPRQSPASEASFIEVARMAELKLMRYKVRIDDVTVGPLWRGQTKQFQVSPGPHYVQVTTARWGWYKSRLIRVDTAPGLVRRLECVGDFGEPGAATPRKEAIILTVARRPTA